MLSYVTKNNSLIITGFNILASILALFAAAQIRINLYFIPFTLQTLIVTLIAFFNTPKNTFLIIAGYIFGGVIGLPFFARFNSGMIFGPASGYIVGFLLGGVVMSYIKSYTVLNYHNIFLINLIGIIIIFTSGVLVLSNYTDIKSSLYYGLIIFIPSEIVKLISQIIIIKKLSK